MTNHIYQNQREQVEELLSRAPLPLPTQNVIDQTQSMRRLAGLLEMRYENLALVGYQSHGKIAAPVAV